MQLYICNQLDHQEEEIIGICLSDVCNSNAISCIYCFKQFHLQHQKDCTTFRTLSKQITLFEKDIKQFIEKVTSFMQELIEICHKLQKSMQEYIDKLLSINDLLKAKSSYPSDSDINILKNFKRIHQQNLESHLITKLYSTVDLISKFYIDTFTFDIENQKVDTDQEQNDNQLIDLDQNTIDVMVQKGIDLLKNNNIQQSLDIFENVLSIDKPNAEAKIWKIQCLMQQKKYHDVVKECDRIIRDDPQCYEIYFKKSEALIELKQLDKVMETIQKGIEINPYGVILLIQQHINLFNNENLDQLNAQNMKVIINQAKQIILQNQNLADIQEPYDYQIAQLQLKSQYKNQTESSDLSDDKQQQKQTDVKQLENTFNSCLDQLNQVIKDKENDKNQIEISQNKDKQQQLHEDTQNPHEKFICAHLKQGDMLIEQKFYEEAIKSYHKIIELDPNNWSAIKNIAQCLNFLERHEESIKYSNLAISVDPQHFDSFLIRGSSQLKLNKYEEAIESFETVIKLDSTQHKAYASKGFALHNLRRFQEAITQFDLALFIFQDVSYLIKKADSLFEMQEYQEAITAYEDALLAGTEDTDYIYEKLKSIQIN